MSDPQQEQRHTPGPWVAIRSMPQEGVDGWWLNAQPHPALRGFTKNIGWVNGGDENEANARLIAAAPIMLAALEDARQELWDMLHSGMSEDEFKQQYASIEAAIALGKGK